MTLPRQVVPGCDYTISRRCSERRYFLHPNKETNDATGANHNERAL